MAIAVKTAFLVKDLHRASLSVMKGQLTYSNYLSLEKTILDGQKFKTFVDNCQKLEVAAFVDGGGASQ